MSSQGRGTRYRGCRELIGIAGWKTLQTCVVLMCRRSVRGENDWSVVDQRLGAIAGGRTSLAECGDLVEALLDDLAEPAQRQTVVDRVRTMMTEYSEEELRQITAGAAVLVDQVCPEQGFSFRVGLTLLSLLVNDDP